VKESLRWCAASGMAAGERGKPSCARGGWDGCSVVTVFVLLALTTQKMENKTKETYRMVSGAK
jgi:hypothetical protein